MDHPQGQERVRDNQDNVEMTVPGRERKGKAMSTAALTTRCCAQEDATSRAAMEDKSSIDELHLSLIERVLSMPSNIDLFNSLSLGISKGYEDWKE